MAKAALPETCSPTPGFLWVWPAGAAYLGPTVGMDAHAASVHCLLVGIDAPVTLSVANGPSITTVSALIPPRTVVQVEMNTHARTLFCYADVTEARGDCLSARMTGRDGSLETGHDAESALIALGRAQIPDGGAIMNIVAGKANTAIDSRIGRTTGRLQRDPAAALGAEQLAAVEGLSRAYFLRLFAAETGTSFRQYRLWMRMLHVARSVSAGADLTRAAADAGFASPSHFSDSFLRMFGMTATVLTSLAGSPIVLDRPWS